MLNVLVAVVLVQANPVHVTKTLERAAAHQGATLLTLARIILLDVYKVVRYALTVVLKSVVS